MCLFNEYCVKLDGMNVVLSLKLFSNTFRKHYSKYNFLAYHYYTIVIYKQQNNIWFGIE